jgi:ABC-type cobalamin transport system ATPase subunit
MARVAKDRLDAVRRYLQQVFPDWALAESWDDDREAQTFMLKKPREPLHLLKVSRSVLERTAPSKLSIMLEGHQVASALRKADKHRLLLTQRGLHQI